MQKSIAPAKALQGALLLPGDKSISHRYAMISAIAGGATRIKRFPAGGDNQSTLRCMEQLGIQVERLPEEVVVHGKGLDGLRASSTDLDCGNSGSTMRMLSGMVRDPRINQAAIDAERGVVLAELRESSGPARRVGDAINAHLFQGQLLADRSPIGTVESLTASRTDGVAAFHKRWYRPDRAVVVITGDGRPGDFAALVAKYYGDWQAEGPSPSQPDFGKPDPAGVAVREIVEANQPLSLTLAQIRPWKATIDTVANTRRLYLEFLALALVNRRLETRARSGGSYLVATVEQPLENLRWFRRRSVPCWRILKSAADPARRGIWL